MRVRMLITKSGAADTLGSVARQYMAGGVYDSPGAMPADVAQVFVGIGAAVTEQEPFGAPEIKPAAPPESKTATHDDEPAPPRRRGRTRR